MSAYEDETWPSIGIQPRGRLGRPGDPDLAGHGGIYQRHHRGGRTYVRKLVYYQPSYESMHSSTFDRLKMKNAVIAWQHLDSDQKAVYNKRARDRILTGFNLFVKEYLLGDDMQILFSRIFRCDEHLSESIMPVPEGRKFVLLQIVEVYNIEVHISEADPSSLIGPDSEEYSVVHYADPVGLGILNGSFKCSTTAQFGRILTSADEFFFIQAVASDPGDSTVQFHFIGYYI